MNSFGSLQKCGGLFSLQKWGCELCGFSRADASSLTKSGGLSDLLMTCSWKSLQSQARALGFAA